MRFIQTFIRLESVTLVLRDKFEESHASGHDALLAILQDRQNSVPWYLDYLKTLRSATAAPGHAGIKWKILMDLGRLSFRKANPGSTFDMDEDGNPKEFFEELAGAVKGDIWIDCMLCYK